MANIKITDLTAYTDAASTDVLPIVDVGADVTKKIAISDIVKAVPQGTAALPGLAFDGDPNTGLFSAGADQVAISTNGTGRLFVDASGNVGVGTASPSVALDVVGQVKASVLFNVNGEGFIRGDTAGQLQIQAGTSGVMFRNNANNTEHARIDSSGRLLVGTSTSLGSNAKVQALTGDLYCFEAYQIGANTYPAQINLTKERGSAGSFAIVQNGDEIGSLSFRGTDGSAIKTAASITAQVDGTPGANDMPGRLIFSTTADGASSPTERMRISSNGIVKATSRYDVTGNFGASANPGDGNAQFASYTAYGATILGQGSSYDIGFLNKGGSFAGYVATGSTTITTSSDERLKENFQPIENALEIVATMRHETGNYKSDPDRQVAFLVAQDVDQHWPYAVDKSNPDSWGVNYNWIIPLHGAAIAELKSIIETQQQLIASLETRLSALEAS